MLAFIKGVLSLNIRYLRSSMIVVKLSDEIRASYREFSNICKIIRTGPPPMKFIVAFNGC